MTFARCCSSGTGGNLRFTKSSADSQPDKSTAKKTSQMSGTREAIRHNSPSRQRAEYKADPSRYYRVRVVPRKSLLRPILKMSGLCVRLPLAISVSSIVLQIDLGKIAYERKR
jgi:hypothetical protein